MDVVGMDIYPGNYQHGSQVVPFNRVKEIFGGKKLITLSECGSVPDPELMQSDGAYWSYFMSWYGDYTKLVKNNSVADWKRIPGGDFVITLNEMPDLTAYNSSSSVPVDPGKNQGKVYMSGNVIRVMMENHLYIYKMGI